MKNLANCKPTEFLAQTVKIKKVVESWLDATKCIEILRTPPKYIAFSQDATAEEKAEVFKKNAKIKRDQAYANASKLFDAAFEENPEETLKVIALCCFVEPEKIDDHPVNWYLTAFNELFHDEAVIAFFSSLAQLGQTNTSMR